MRLGHEPDDAERSPSSVLFVFCSKKRSRDDHAAMMARVGVSVSDDLTQCATELLGGWCPLSVFDRPLGVAPLGSAWRHFLSCVSSREGTHTLILVLTSVLYALYVHPHDTQVALSSTGLRVFETHRGIMQRLMSVFHFLGRELIREVDTVGEGRLCMKEVIALGDALTDLDSVSTRTVRLHGQRGVALLVLARKECDADAAQQLERATSDLRVANELGDSTPKHFAYRLEALNRLYALNANPTILAEAARIARRHARQHHDCWALHIAVADVLISVAKHQEKKGIIAPAFRTFQRVCGLLQEAQASGDPDQDASHLFMRLARTTLKLHTVSFRIQADLVDPDLSNTLSYFESAGELAMAPGSPFPTAALLRARQLEGEGKVREAASMTQLGLAVAPSASPSPEETSAATQLRAFQSEREVLMAIDDGNWQHVRTSLRALLDAADKRFFPVKAVFFACRELISRTKHPPGDRLLLEASQALERFVHYGLQSGEPLRFSASHAGTLFLKLHGTADIHVVERAHELLLIALEAVSAPPAAELSAWLATTSWTLAESHQEAGDEATALDLLRDAKDHSLAALEIADDSAAFDKAVMHSKIAVLLLRIQAVTGDLGEASNAIQHMEAAIELGGELPPRLGHLGDAYYRIGRATLNPDCLRKAVRYKRAACASSEGDQSRENRSVTAAIFRLLWQCSGDTRYLLEAIEEIADAVNADSSWPWPLFQLADALGLQEQALDGAATQDSLSDEANALLASVNWCAAEARSKGCELAVRSTEFARMSLGGRRQSAVHVLSDPHGLLRQAVVFKLNRRGLAAREAATISQLEAFLPSKDAPAYFRCPSPIGCVMDTKGNEWYSVSYERGTDLGRLIAWTQPAGTAGRERLYDRIGKAVHFLALFHACFGIRGPKQPRFSADTERFWQEDVGEKLSPLVDAADEIVAELRKLVPRDLLLCRKKDAHPENWLVTSAGDIVIIDFESSRYLPITYEVAQLIEDYPALPVSEEGWEMRIALVQQYVDYLHLYSPGLAGATATSREDLENMYSVFALVRAISGISRNFGKEGSERSSSARRRHLLRQAHYSEVLEGFSSSQLGGRNSPLGGLVFKSHIDRIRRTVLP